MNYIQLKNNQFIVCCTLYSSSPIDINFLFDTGACETVVCWKYIRMINLQFTGEEKPFMSYSGKKLVCKQVFVKNFDINGISVGPVKIWVTDNAGISKNLLGMDLLGKVDFNYLVSRGSMGVRMPFDGYNVRVINNNVYYYLTTVLMPLNLENKRDAVLSLLPKNIDMQLTDFKKLVTDIINTWLDGGEV